MANTSCLQGLRCPECKSWGPLEVEVKTLVLVTDEGTDPWWKGGGDTEWAPDSFCRCHECGYEAEVQNFNYPKRRKK